MSSWRRAVAGRLPFLRGIVAELEATRAELRRAQRQRQKSLQKVRHLEFELRKLHEAMSRDGVDRQREERTVPSFVSRTETLRRVRQLARSQFGRSDPVWEYNSKPAGRALATRLGVPVPAEIVPPTPLHQLALPTTHERFVIKPVNGTGGRGVAPLVADGPDRFLHLFRLDLGPVEWSTISQLLDALVAQGVVSSRFFVEELIQDRETTALPIDWKFFCIGGEVALIYGRDVRNRREPNLSVYRYFSPQWEDLGPLRYPERHSTDIETPEDGPSLNRAAETIAGALLPTPFVRVDLFDGPQGPVFGEITPQPGSALWFGDALDQELGRLWDTYEAGRIGVDLPPPMP